MAGYESKRRYRVNGNLAEVIQQEVENEAVRKRAPKEEKKRAKRVLPRTAVDMIPFAYAIVVAMACAVILVGSVAYVHTKTNVTKYTKQLVAAQTELEELKAKNKETQTELSISMDLNEIKKRAKALGMVEAGKGQIIYYEQSDSEYVRQKEDIPTS